jgi:hypothetical protein
MRAIVGVLLLSSSPVAAIASFPEVVPLDARFTFQRPEQANLKVGILITGTGGTEDGYTLECHTWRQSERSIRSDFDYSGDFECRLLALNGDNPIPTLLGHEIPMVRDWDSRGRFFAEQLVGKCGEHPDYGRTRTFKLRGMRLTLTIQDAEVQLESVDHQSPLRHDVLGRFVFKVQVAPDSAARSMVAEPPTYSEPIVREGQRLPDCSRLARWKSGK